MLHRKKDCPGLSILGFKKTKLNWTKVSEKFANWQNFSLSLVGKKRAYTAIPNRELQGLYREIWVQGNSNYMLWQCTGFAGSIFVVKKGIPCIYYWISSVFITLTFVQSLNEFPCKISLSQGKACNGEMETNVMLTLLFYVAITGKIM